MKFWAIENKGKTDAAEKFDKSKPLIVDEDTANYQIAECCNPIPGDDVIGYQGCDDELIIHKTSCPEAIKLNSSEANKVVKVEWISQKILAFLGRIFLKGIDDIGVLNDVTNVISKELNVNMRSINIESHDGVFEGVIDVYVHNTNDLNNLILKLSSVKGMTQVVRKEIKDELIKD